jgi:hypothetical protein
LTVLPQSSFFGGTRRSLRVALKVSLVVLVSCAVFFLAIFVVFKIKYSHAATLLEELKGIQLEESESSLTPLIKRYNASRSEHELGPEDHTFVFIVDPWRLLRPLPGPEWIDHSYRWAFSEAGTWRRRLKLRAWVATGWVRLTDGKAGVVSGNLVIEGENEWLMADWHYGATIPAQRRTRQTDGVRLPSELSQFDAIWTHLHFGDGTGEGVYTSVTPLSSPEQLNAARSIDLSCLLSGSGCRSLCVLLPEADRYRRAHNLRDWGWNSGSWGEQPRDCQ